MQNQSEAANPAGITFPPRNKNTVSLNRLRSLTYDLICPIEQRAGRWYVSTRIGPAEDRDSSLAAISVHGFDVAADIPKEIDGACFDAVIGTREPNPRFYGIVLSTTKQR